MIANKNIKLVRSLKWEEVFSFWYQNEGDKENWQKLAQERGFTSWADWRLTAYARPFACAKAKWGLYKVTNLGKVVPQFYGGPFRSWVKNRYDGAREKTFSELATLPDIINHSFTQRVRGDFPTDKVISCLAVGGKIYVVEGMHRCCALAVMAKENKELPNWLYFAIGQSSLKELPIVGSSQ